MTTTEMNRRQDLLDRQSKILNENGIMVYERNDRAMRIVVSRNDLIKAQDFKLEDVTIASRA